MHASVLSVPVAAAICRIVRRNHSRSPHLREPVREIHSLRTGRFHGAPGRAMNLPCPITPHHETVTRLFREKPATGQPPSRIPLHKSSPSQNSQTKPSASSTSPSATRPNHQQPDQSISTTQRQKTVHRPKTVSQPKNCQPTKEPSVGQKTAHQPKNHQPAKKLPTRPNRQQHDQTACNQTKLQPAREPSTSQRTARRPKNHQQAKLPYFRALPSLKALPTLAPRGR